jgi:hypothetical protein
MPAQGAEQNRWVMCWPQCFAEMNKVGRDNIDMHFRTI